MFAVRSAEIYISVYKILFKFLCNMSTHLTTLSNSPKTCQNKSNTTRAIAIVQANLLSILLRNLDNAPTDPETEFYSKLNYTYG